MKKYITFIILLEVVAFDRRDHAEAIENKKFDSWDDFHKLMKELHDGEVGKYEMLSYTLGDFTTICNDEEFNPNIYWMSYIHIAQPEG